MKHNSNSEANIFSASQQTFPNFMESESLLPLSRDPLENKFTIFGFNTSGKKKKTLESELRWQRKISHIQ